MTLDDDDMEDFECYSDTEYCDELLSDTDSDDDAADIDRIWKRQARITQLELYRDLGQSFWDEYKEADHAYITSKLIFSLFGPPAIIEVDPDVKEESSDNISQPNTTVVNQQEKVADHCIIGQQYSNFEKRRDDTSSPEISDNAGYNKDQRRTSEEIMKTIVKICGGRDIYMAVIFFVSHSDGKISTFPVFRIRMVAIDECYYVDGKCRVYKGFQDFLENNTTPKCSYCYPKFGYYSCDQQDVWAYDPELKPTLAFCESPSSSILSQTASTLDVLGTVAGLAAGGAVLAGKQSGVLLAAATVSGLYSAGRSGIKLKDRDDHGQSIHPDNKESITSYLSIAGSVIGLGAAAGASAAANAAKAGSTMSTGTRAIVTALNVGAVGIGGCGLGVGVYELIEKGKKNELSSLDVLQFSTALFFFSHSVVNFKTASTIIKDEQNAYLRGTRNNLSSRTAKRGLKKFSRINYENGGEGQMNKNAHVIRQLNKIDNPDQFMNGLTKTLKRVDLNGKNDVTFSDGLVRLNKELDIDPNVFNNMSEAVQSKLIKTTNDYRTGLTNYEQFSKNIAGIEKQHRLVLNTKKDIFVQSLANSFGAKELSSVSVGGKRIFEDMKYGDVNRLSRLCKGKPDNFDPKMMNMVKSFAEEFGCTTSNQFAGYMEFAYKHINDSNKNKAEKAAYIQKLQNPKSNESTQMRNSYNAMRSEIKSVHSKSPLKFDSDISAIYHHDKHCKHNGETISVARYFRELPISLFNKTHEVKSTVAQDGAQIIRTYFNRSTKLYGTLIEKTVNGQVEQTIGTMYHRG